MTTLERIIADRQVTVYSISKQMGLNPTASSSDIAKRIRGERAIKKATLSRIVRAIEALSGQPVVMGEIEMEPQTVFIR